MSTQTIRTDASGEMVAACDGVRQAMFAAADRVIRYHQAALDAKVSKLMRADPKRATGRSPLGERRV